MPIYLLNSGVGEDKLREIEGRLKTALPDLLGFKVFRKSSGARQARRAIRFSSWSRCPQQTANILKN